jgi:hypothetical protein
MVDKMITCSSRLWVMLNHHSFFSFMIILIISSPHMVGYHIGGWSSAATKVPAARVK